MLSQRARISPASGNTTIVTPQLTVSGNGNVFQNISLFEGGSENSVTSTCVSVTGVRNYFNNVAVLNMGSANSADEANSANVKIDGGEENYFQGCYIGLDTIARSTTNANVELVGQATRNTFKDCFFPIFADSATALFVKVDGALDIDRWVRFENCTFINAVNSTATTMTAAMDIHGTPGGTVIVKDCALIGATDWEAATNANIWLMGPVPAAATTGISVTQTT